MFVFTDESAISEHDLIRVYDLSPLNEPVTHWVRHSNPKWYSLLPAIDLHGILALTV
ncbi:hypothetical protein CROQUDRAFT_663519 [Cronartium quercuum f. sp. fusiforme G11]|uniref:Uncharacterized protein n=1 Tax=Cronartium quercuum f. sp. fusiforme G11 TaxID=708437 RepID=A0A9P6T8N4_9BASI|nr:hypothetical protein CROQUDRAFT_663519 [Cronartium quercuum f. sp. fusiforme G11]